MAALPSLVPAEILANATKIRICQLVAVIVTLYDHLITIDQEVDLVWSKTWSLSKTLFLWNRYFGEALLIADAAVFMSTSLSQNFCYHWLRCQGWASAIVVWSMQVIMQFRIFAMYKRSRSISIFVAVCFIGEVIAMSSILAYSYKHIDAVSEPLSQVHICTPINVPSYFYAFWLPIISFECILLLLALWIGGQHIFELWTLRQWDSERVISILLRDSIFYFLATLAAYTTNAVLWLTYPAIWIEIPTGFSISTTCIMGCRMLLNLRGACYSSETFYDDGVALDSTSRLRALPRPVPVERRPGSKWSHPSTAVQSLNARVASLPLNPSRWKSGRKSSVESSSGRKGGQNVIGENRELKWKWDERSGTLSGRASPSVPNEDEDTA